MMNVQVIDGAMNCTYSSYAFTDDEFAKMFHAPGQDIEFIDDAEERLGAEELGKILGLVWERPVRKSEAQGIHGTLFYELEYKGILPQQEGNRHPRPAPFARRDIEAALIQPPPGAYPPSHPPGEGVISSPREPMLPRHWEYLCAHV